MASLMKESASKTATPSWANGRPKTGLKVVQNPHPITENPVKHVSHEKRGVQKEVKNRLKNGAQKWTLNGPKPTENIPEQFPQKSTKNPVNVK